MQMENQLFLNILDNSMNGAYLITPKKDCPIVI